MEDEREFRAQIDTRLKATLEELRAAESQVTRLKRRVEGFKEILASFEQPKPEVSLFRLPSSKRALSHMSIKDAAKTVIKHRGEPMTAREIFDEIVAGGRKPGGKSPIETLRATLRSTDDTFKKTPDSKWTLTDPDTDLVEVLKEMSATFGKARE